MKSEYFLAEIESLPLFTAIHLIETHLLQADSHLGSDALPKNEKIQLTVSQRLGYEARELINVVSNSQSNKLTLQTNIIGLTGEQGVLPSHYSELVMQRARENDTAMKDFFDIFNHRLLSLYYRCWLSYQLAAQFRSKKNIQSSPIQKVLSSLTGNCGSEAIFWGGVFSTKQRSRGFVKNIVEFYTDCEVLIDELRGEWVHMDEDDQTRLCGRNLVEGQHSALGLGAVIGKRIWDVSGGITILLLPKDSEVVYRILSKGGLDHIKSLVTKIVGAEKTIQWKLRARYEQLPKASLKRGIGCIGRGSILKVGSPMNKRFITITV
ncbi:type VI secretion system baseplate subunit TssG [Vibrio vulnificus]|uniref:type VI secretion system baseplate subunit TssG n=1 Tax=Vibrio vulnificus TaxID=672 RepID=UPI0019D45509|nr:type VI secretion system baseplate subunit TssG [Vibrio vulnificus]MBN8091908.1 type VI secretion system baseplate subunit TssG [Vibrio vulnificus]HAS6054978.1 type VI secretion system baseplate subunit TssG [Vibrio vulnificus]HAS6258963.1 type VI secretion system baseplate subunit TssG [Vibrio vulnificus]HAS8442027.1 type VI secretion system baseplate subunit TssG [Vibrio vulnificus]HAV6897109.1 type VI secretion system baseplate subunit TssG [Vibrio vulnificus]